MKNMSSTIKRFEQAVVVADRYLGESSTSNSVNKNMKQICFYHRDIDGMCSAAIVYRFSSKKCDLIDINYGEEFPWEKLDGRDTVYMVDFALQPFKEMVRLQKLCNSKGAKLVWIDHHIESLNEAKKFGFKCDGLRKDGLAGCELTWHYLYPKKPMPRAVYFAGRFDVWDHSDSKVLPVHYSMESMNLSPSLNVWDTLLNKNQDQFDEEVRIGKKIMAWVDNFNKERMLELAFPLEFEGLKCIAANSSMRSSEAFKSVSDGYDAILKFEWGNTGIWTISLYGLGRNVDVGKICSKYGGGGHKSAGGFQCKKLPFRLSSALAGENSK